ncbi:hypothetical protein [Fibrobacter sp. UWEL]|uniref:hypothetical protein n=1 Tax=Fibrobacter sp. UWEL TaxID=1896209 RepID=UPI0009135FEB|nr:hypothetical protein [Fibrobacter sp. UWEL]SHK94416.1 hypothetical protein SAMN05720468_11014 [Fibrobacter sp. UWEL]
MIINNINDNITYRLVKGDIQMKRMNPWIRPFLRYIENHPHCNEVDICRDLLCDNGNARKAAVKNILFFFKQQGLLAYDSVNGYELTNNGMAAFESGNIWQGMKGAFAITLWTPSADCPPFILDVQPVPEHWYDSGKNGLEDFPEEYGNNLCNLTLCSKSIKLDVVKRLCRPTYFNTDFKAKVNSKGEVKISGTSSVNGFNPYEVEFKVNQDLLSVILDDTDDDEF